jgi:hypothetical protein
LYLKKYVMQDYLIETSQGKKGRSFHATAVALATADGLWDSGGSTIRPVYAQFVGTDAELKSLVANLEAGRKAEKSSNRSTNTDRWRRLRDWALPCLGSLPVDRIGKSHVRTALEAAVAGDAAHGSVLELRSDISAVLSELVADDVLPVNHALACKLPEGRRDTRRRAIPTTQSSLFSPSAAPTSSFARRRS